MPPCRLAAQGSGPLTFSRDLRTLCRSRSFWMLRAILWRAPLVTFCVEGRGAQDVGAGRLGDLGGVPLGIKATGEGWLWLPGDCHSRLHLRLQVLLGQCHHLLVAHL